MARIKFDLGYGMKIFNMLITDSFRLVRLLCILEMRGS